MSMLKLIAQYIEGNCPLLGTGGEVKLGKLPNAPIGFCVESKESAVVIKQYVDGTAVRRFSFTFSIITATHEHASELLDNFSSWLEEQNELDLGENRTFHEFFTHSPEMFLADNHTVRYRMPCWLVYVE